MGCFDTIPASGGVSLAIYIIRRSQVISLPKMIVYGQLEGQQ
jgi:hypothetical protein